jgi:hypothetical protein
VIAFADDLIVNERSIQNGNGKLCESGLKAN